MPSHSVKQAKVMSAIAHGWRPSGLDIPVKVAKDFHAADAGHKYGKGMDKKSKALRATKHYRKARGGSIEGDGKDDVSYGGTLPRSLQPMTTQIPDSWMQRPLPKYRYADGGDVDWSKLNQPFGELKGTAPEDTPVQFRTASPYVNITEGDIDRGMNIGMAAGPGVMVGPYGAHMLRAADRAAGRPTMPHPVVETEIADKAASLRPEFRDAYKGQVQDMRDAEARAALESRQGSLNAPISDRDIWPRSGWSRGSEGMPKKEIPDTGAKLVESPVPDEHGHPMYELKHPAGNFHEIYDVPPIKFDSKMPEGNGSFNRFDNQIIIGGKPTKENLEAAVSPVLHEFQHSIQKKEGFAYGSNLAEAQVRPEMSQELFPSNQLSAAEIARYGTSPGRRAEIPSWHQKMAERQRAHGEDPTSEAAAFRRANFETYRKAAGETEPRNVQYRWEHNDYLKHPEDTEDITRGLQWENRSMMPRPKPKLKLPEPEIQPSWLDIVNEKQKKRASGGGVGNFNPERGAAIGLSRQGIIKSTVPGRTDKLNLNVPSGSYVIPADIPSALGQGNTTAGGAILDRMFNKGPYGMNLPRAKSGSRVGQRKSSLSKQSFADGGDTGQITPILAAGGEYMIHPETVSNLGNGDMDLGHSILDSFVKQVRAKHISTLRRLAPPKGSK